jgi:hypothetical protein
LKPSKIVSHAASCTDRSSQVILFGRLQSIVTTFKG